MAQVKIEEVIEHLDSEIKRALEEAVQSILPDAEFDRTQLYREFKKQVYRRCNVWETVPDQYVRVK